MNYKLTIQPPSDKETLWFTFNIMTVEIIKYTLEILAGKLRLVKIMAYYTNDDNAMQKIVDQTFTKQSNFVEIKCKSTDIGSAFEHSQEGFFLLCARLKAYFILPELQF